MPRRSEPDPILSSRPYKVGDVWHVGSKPILLCSTCRLIRYDPGEFGCCPGCVAWYAHQERLRWQALTNDYIQTRGGPLYKVVIH